METKVLSSHEVDKAVAFLKRGELVAIPTETVYGLAADASNPEAIAKIFKAKNRPADHPVILHISDPKQVADWAYVAANDLSILADAFWPGPLTLILPKKPSVSPLITGGQATIGIRMPDHAVALEIISKLKMPVVAPSANIYTRTSPTTAQDVLQTLNGRIAAVIDGGACSVGLESTILDLSRAKPQILRPGAITRQMLENVLEKAVEEPLRHTAKVAGNVSVHYQPKKKVRLIPTAELQKRQLNGAGIAILHYTAGLGAGEASYYQMPKEKKAYAKRLYHMLYLIDSTQAAEIYIERLPDDPAWRDVQDRLSRMASE